MPTVYGLKSCDTCRKALKALGAAGVDPTEIDIRGEADLPALVPGWLDAVGTATLVNTRSTTWRGLSDAERAQADDPTTAARLLAAHPTLVKRPVIVADDGAVLVGWTPATRAALGL